MITKEISNVLQNQNYTYRFFIGNPVSTFHFSPYTGIAFGQAQLSKDDGSFVNTINSAIEIGNGWYKITLNASEMTGTTLLLIMDTNHLGQEVCDSVLFHLVSSIPTTLDTQVGDVDSISTTNPTMQEVLSMMWLAMTRNANKKGWDLATWLKKFSF